LYEYYVDIYGIITTDKFYNTTCYDYYKYATFKERLYDYFMNPCSISYKVDCPNFLRNVNSTIQKRCYLSLCITKIC
ncbi:hypothetical protein PCYB_006430, partial [Plasmodium cynomolgi strain B]